MGKQVRIIDKSMASVHTLFPLVRIGVSARRDH